MNQEKKSKPLSLAGKAIVVLKYVLFVLLLIGVFQGNNFLTGLAFALTFFYTYLGGLKIRSLDRENQKLGSMLFSYVRMSPDEQAELRSTLRSVDFMENLVRKVTEKTGNDGSPAMFSVDQSGNVREVDPDELDGEDGKLNKNSDGPKTLGDLLK